MVARYFCDRCGKESNIYETRIVLGKKDFDEEFCTECIEELLENPIPFQKY
jgi:hypothetical protein